MPWCPSFLSSFLYLVPRQRPFLYFVLHFISFVFWHPTFQHHFSFLHFSGDTLASIFTCLPCLSPRPSDNFTHQYLITQSPDGSTFLSNSASFPGSSASSFAHFPSVSEVLPILRFFSYFQCCSGVPPSSYVFLHAPTWLPCFLSLITNHCPHHPLHNLTSTCSQNSSCSVWPMTMVLIGCPKTTADNYQHKMYTKQVEQSPHVHCSRSAKSRTQNLLTEHNNTINQNRSRILCGGYLHTLQNRLRQNWAKVASDVKKLQNLQLSVTLAMLFSRNSLSLPSNTSISLRRHNMLSYASDCART